MINKAKQALQTKLNAARAAVNEIEYGEPAWEPAMQVVRDLVDQFNAQFPPAPWTDKEYKDMLSR